MILETTTDFANQVDDGKTIGISFHYFSEKNNRFVSSLVKKLLERQNLEYLKDTVNNILRELIVNAVKANSKRYYFLRNKRDISNEEQYHEGMEQFHDFIVDNGEKIENDLKKNNLRVEIYIKKDSEELKFYVRNTTPLLPVELERIHSRMEKASKYNDFSEVYNEVSDVSEGEGLGLLLTMLFLKNSGIGERSLTIGSDGKVTQATLTIPAILKPKNFTNEIQDRILAEVDDLPSIPDHVREIQSLCYRSDVPIRLISDKIMTDPSLAISVLKLSNSAGFITRNKAESVYEAVKIIGMKNLNAILAASSAKAILDNKYSAYKQIWEHCNRVAFYAREIAESRGSARIADKVFLAGLLHDLGKIVLLATSSTLNDWIEEVTTRRDIRSSTIIEELSIGISHATIGEMIARKWNMPEHLTEAIKHHHSPSLASGENFPVVAITYLANEMCDIEKGRFTYHHLESDVLDVLGIHSEEEFVKVHESLKATYSGDLIV